MQMTAWDLGLLLAPGRETPPIPSFKELKTRESSDDSSHQPEKQEFPRALEAPSRGWQPRLRLCSKISECAGLVFFPPLCCMIDSLSTVKLGSVGALL